MRSTEELSSAIVRDALKTNEDANELASRGEVREGQSLLESTEEVLMERIKKASRVEPDISAVLLITWNNLSLAHKKQNEYFECFKRLMRIHRVESLVGISPLELATTKINLGMCCHSLDRPADSITHATAAQEILSRELSNPQQQQKPEDEAYRRKLFLNYILALFNRGVHFLVLGDLQKFRLNVTQSLELATQKFGKDQPITKMISTNAAKKDLSELKPFFVTKNYDFTTLHYHSRLAEGKYLPSDYGVDSREPAGPKRSPTINSSKATNENTLVGQTRPSSRSRPESRTGQASSRSIDKPAGKPVALPLLSSSTRPISREATQQPTRKIDSILLSGNSTGHTFYGEVSKSKRYDEMILVTNGREDFMSSRTGENASVWSKSSKQRKKVTVEIVNAKKALSRHLHKSSSTQELEQLSKPPAIPQVTIGSMTDPQPIEPPAGFYADSAWHATPRSLNLSKVTLALQSMK